MLTTDKERAQAEAEAAAKEAAAQAKADAKAAKDAQAEAAKVTVTNLCKAPENIVAKVRSLFPGQSVEIVMVGPTQAGINVIGKDGKKDWQKVSIV